MSELGPFGYGQQQPQDYGSDANVIDFIVRQRIAQVTTAKLVKVVAVHLGSGSPPSPATVDVLPLINQIDGNGFAVPHQTVYGLRVLRFQAGPWAIIADPVVGDIGIIICIDRDSSSATSAGAQVTPQSRRRYSISDGVYIGCVLNNPPTGYLQLKSDGTLNITDANGNSLVSGANGWTLTGNVVVNGTVQATDFITGSLASYATHTHTGVTTGAGTSGPPSPGS